MLGQRIVPPLRLAAIVAMSCALAAPPTRAGSLKPNGDPTHNGVADPKLGSAMSADKKYTVSLGPNPALFRAMGNCSWLVPAAELASQPYNNADNVWKYTTATLKGSFTLNDYEAWADDKPKVTLNGASPTSGAEPGRGGAAFVLLYNPGVGDPAAADVHWMSVIDTNQPSARGVKYGTKIGDGTTIYLDNASAADGSGTTPYYGALSGFKFGNGTGFLDETDFGLAASAGINWQSQSFLTTETDTVVGKVTTHNVTIYDGVWWGFNISAAPAPEPAAIVQVACGAGILLAAVAIRRRASA